VPLPQEALPPGARSLDEQNVSDKPSFMRALPRIDGTTLGSMRKRYDCALAAIHSVDRSVGGLFSALRHAGLWSSTVVILTSDNGFFFGEHRLPQGKDLPYEEAIRQPLIIRVPRAYAPHQVARSPVAAANIDLAPTILKLAGATPCRAARHCRTLDGRSLLGPVKGRTGAFRGRHLLVELSEPSGVVALDPRPGVCAFKTVWRPSEMFSIYSRLFKAGTGHCEAASVTERYNLRTDPLELRNVAQSSSRHDRELSRRLARLARCAGVRGRDRRVAGRPYCE
jgi:arylsulfatase A-like enzyme